MKGFLLEQDLAELSRSFTLIIFSTPFILLVLFNITLIKKDGFLSISSNGLLLLLCSIAVTAMFGIFIYNALQDNAHRFIFQVLSIIVEIISVLFAFQKDKQKRITELLTYFSLCFLTGILSYCTIGILEKYLHFQPLDNKLIFIFTAIFFHFLNACFIGYKSLYKNKIAV